MYVHIVYMIKPLVSGSFKFPLKFTKALISSEAKSVHLRITCDGKSGSVGPNASTITRVYRGYIYS